jgi:L-threonylcarbamoyladenylate synthase
MRRVFVDPEAPQRDALNEAAKWIRAGRVVAIPTDTLYGLAADPFNAAAVALVFAIKGRPDRQPLPLIAADTEQIAAHLGRLPGAAERLAARFWPGPLTLLIPATDRLAAGVSAGTGRVGVRIPRDGVARAICSAVERPITATSANVSGHPPASDPAEVERALGNQLDLLIDVGPTPGGLPSTIVDVTTGPPTLVRPGAVDWEDIRRCLESR